MPRLDSAFIVLKDDFNKVMKDCSNDRGAKFCNHITWPFLDRVKAKDTRDTKRVGWIDI